MDVYNPIGSSNHLTSLNNTSEFHDDAYMEYRRRVFAQLAADYQVKKNDNSPVANHPDPDHQPSSNNPSQPSWDDSDLFEETYVIPTQQTQTNHLNGTTSPEQFSQTANQTKPLMNWSAINAHINQIDNDKALTFDPSTLHHDKSDDKAINSTWSEKNGGFQEQKLKREAIRRKLSLGESDEGEDFAADKSWTKFSANSQSLHICYINESCSSDSDQETTSPNHHSISFSPISSPSFTASRMLAKKYARSNLPPDSSSTASSSSSSSVKNDNSLMRRIEGASPSKGVGINEQEMEIRFELAKAHQRAKKQAEEEKKKEKLTFRASLAHRLLSDTLPEHTASRLKSYSLTFDHCRSMTLGQLQLILNDMHAKKQALNERLMSLLMERDDLHTEQDAKLVDVDDAKSMLDAAGPETAV